MSYKYELKLNKEETFQYMIEAYPPCLERISIESLEPMVAKIRYKIFESDWRPGGTVSGPAIFSSADAAMWTMVLAMAGKKALSVTSSANIYFLRKPSLKDLINEVRIVKFGRTSIVGDCLVYADGENDPVAQASLSYHIPT